MSGTVAKPKKKQQIDELKSALGDELTAEERAYLAKLENALKDQVDYENPEEVEAEIRRREKERIARNYKPRTPLYTETEANDTREVKTGTNDRKSSYQNDPRYKEYYERLRQARGSTNTPYEEDVQPMTMDDLEKRGYDAAVGKPSSRPAAGPRPAPVPRPVSRPMTQQTTSIQARRAPATPPQPSGSYEYASGSILRLDDGSVAIFKDAVSGKDYALLYFLEPDGTVAPRGIFLQQYDAQRIGHLPEPLFAQMRDGGTWDRDAVIFHLEKYEFAQMVRQVAAHQEGRTPAHHARTTAPSSAPVEEQPQYEAPAVQAEPAKPRDMLERGRVLRINVGGKVWESVYWTKDEMGPIVAHNTHKDWALMHLDLKRFQDSLEYGDLLTGSKLAEIETSLAKQS
jgi:hypothetical protein